MSRQTEAKAAQGFQTKPRTCGNCAHFRSTIEEVPRTYGGGTWTKESHMRCGVGSFKVGRSNTCDMHAKNGAA